MKVQVMVDTKKGQYTIDPVQGAANTLHVIGRTFQGAKVGLHLGVAEVKSGTVSSSALTKEQKRIVIEAAIQATLKML